MRLTLILLMVRLRSNRTFMELKLPGVYQRGIPGFRSNRTFMELKCTLPMTANIPTTCSNRTFMELKFL